jgi:sarcosine oxidase
VPSAIVVGAGVFGSSLARHLAAAEWDVTLVDRYPPGHVRAASGGESRVIRCSHGADRWYARSARRARELWRGVETEARSELLVEAGVLWLAHREDGWEAESERTLREEGIPAERLAPEEAARLFPSFDPSGLAFCLHEPEAGVLRARDAARVLAAQAQARGARFVGGVARPVGGEVDVEGERLAADRVVWACGAWLPSLFPGLVRLRVTRQDVFFFGAPFAWQTPPLPAWMDYEEAVYGLGDLDGRGVKAAWDREGPEFDPDRDRRSPSAEAERATRAYVERRFPALAGAPLVGTRTCPYALTQDTNFIVAPHPEHDGVWILGGGSGHGFKHGPALAEYVASLLAGATEPDERFGLAARDPGPSFRTAVTGVARDAARETV